MAKRKQRKSKKIDITLDLTTWQRLAAIADLAGVSKNDVINVIMAKTVLDMKEEGK